ncbi:MAG: caspase family protein [Phormidesmis sp.]
MGLSRRALIRQTGAAALALGLSDLALSLGSDLGSDSGMASKARSYSQALAESTGRKLALLIGINRYPEDALSRDRNKPLTGATTDVALQKALLIYRFGFLPEDIVCLTNESATRSGIYQAFVDHLYNQAQPGDTVVFHFSGYGAQVRISDLTGGQETVRSLVPYNGFLPTEERPVLNDISEIELKMLLRQLKTKNITTVLDAGFVDMAMPLSGGLRSRARSAIVTGQMPAPFPLLSKERLGKESEAFPGILLRGAAVDEVAIERQWTDFNAGAFSYVLTQYLWTAPAPVSVAQAIGRSQETLLRWGGSRQQPTASGNRAAEKKLPIYNTLIQDGSRGEGAIQSVSAGGLKATLWLGGFSPRVLEYLGSSSIVSCGNRRLQLRSRDGLTASAKLISPSGSNSAKTSATAANAPLQAGESIFEAVRVLPRSIPLVVALDSRLERIERVDATSALSALTFVSSTSDTELPADCLLAKPTADRPETLTASLWPSKFAEADSSQSASPNKPSEMPDEAGQSGYGLFSLTRSLIPGTLALQDEAIKPAISRLTPKLQSLLALKMLRLSENRAASQLPVRVRLEMIEPEEKLLISRQTFRTAQLSEQLVTKANSLSREGFCPPVPIGSRVHYRLFNEGDQPLYYTLINVDPLERLSAFCPIKDLPSASQNEATGEMEIAGIADTTIAPNSSITIPDTPLDWPVKAPTGPIETYIVCSSLPLVRTFNILLRASANTGNQHIGPLPEPLSLVEALLADLNQGDSTDSYTLDVAQWATLNFAYQAV